MGMNETNNTWQELTETIERMKNEPTLSPSVAMETANTVMDMLQEKEEFVDAAMEKTAEIINEPFRPRNRAERRAWEKELKKKNKNKRVFADNLRQAAERLAYTEMIQRVRKMNEEFEKEGAQEDEAAN